MKIKLVFISLSVAISLLNFYITENYIFSIILFVLFILFFFLFVERKINLYKKNRELKKECINFINNFILSCSVTNSVEIAYLETSNTFKNNLERFAKSIEELTIEDKLIKFKEYFNLEIFDVFTQLINQFISEGGNLLKQSEILLYDLNEFSLEIDNEFCLIKKKITDFIILWSLNILILIIIRFALASYYKEILMMNFYPYAIFIFFIIIIFNLIFFLNNSIEVKGVRKHEKVQK